MLFKDSMKDDKQLPVVYQPGQLVYTKSNIRGWFDKSLKSFIPANTPCTIVSHHATESYLVRFDGKFIEFGDYIISPFDLRLG